METWRRLGIVPCVSYKNSTSNNSGDIVIFSLKILLSASLHICWNYLCPIKIMKSTLQVDSYQVRSKSISFQSTWLECILLFLLRKDPKTSEVLTRLRLTFLLWCGWKGVLWIGMSKVSFSFSPSPLLSPTVKVVNLEVLPRSLIPILTIQLGIFVWRLQFMHFFPSGRELIRFCQQLEIIY